MNGEITTASVSVLSALLKKCSGKLVSDIKRSLNDLTHLKTAFKERFASSPHDWIFLQQLSAPKQRSKKPLGDYVVSMPDQLKLCKL